MPAHKGIRRTPQFFQAAWPQPSSHWYAAGNPANRVRGVCREYFIAMTPGGWYLTMKLGGRWTSSHAYPRSLASAKQQAEAWDEVRIMPRALYETLPAE